MNTFKDIFPVWVLKFLMPAIVMWAVNMAIQMKVKKITFSIALLSLVSGVGCAYLFYDIIKHNFSENYVTGMIALATILGEKICYWFIFKFNIDVIGKAFEQGVTDWIRRIFK